MRALYFTIYIIINMLNIFKNAILSNSNINLREIYFFLYFYFVLIVVNNLINNVNLFNLNIVLSN